MIFDIATGKALPDMPFKHHSSILAIALPPSTSNSPHTTPRTCTFIDNQQECFLIPLLRTAVSATTSTTLPVHKLAINIESMIWHPEYPILTALGDKRLLTWYWPVSLYVDASLGGIKSERLVPIAPGGNTLLRFDRGGSQVTLRRGDGAVVTLGIGGGDGIAAGAGSLVPAVHEMCRRRAWDEAARLCRFAQVEKRRK